MNGHAARKASAREERVALDVASRTRARRWADGSWVTELQLEVAELPGPLSFPFRCVEEEDGTQRWVCQGMEWQFEPTGEQRRYIADSFDRFLRLAELRLFGTTIENAEASRRIRRGMTKKRTRGERWTGEERALLVEDWRALAGDPRRMQILEQREGIRRFAIYRQLDRARDEGLISLDEWPRRRP